jgi:hypothetical protein
LAGLSLLCGKPTREHIAPQRGESSSSSMPAADASALALIGSSIYIVSTACNFCGCSPPPTPLDEHGQP